MGTSIYYTAARPTPLSDAEQASVDRVVADQNAGFPFDYEVLTFYPADVARPGIVLDGSTKITMDLSETIPSIAYWCTALTELRGLVPDARWSVHLEGVEIPWSDERGYRLAELDEMVELMAKLDDFAR